MNFVGDKFYDLGANKYDTLEICRHLRADLKSQFPKPWKFTVKRDHYSAITISIKSVPKNVVKNLEKSKHTLLKEHFGPEIYNKLMEIGNAYNYDNSDGSVDYFDTNYYLYWNLLNINIV